MATSRILIAGAFAALSTAAPGQRAGPPVRDPEAACVRSGAVPWTEVVRGCTVLLAATQARYDRLLRQRVVSARERAHALAEIYLTRSNAHMALSHRPLAIADASAAIRLEPRNADAYVARGFIYYLMTNDRAAITDFTAALRFNPANPAALNYRGLTYLRGHDPVRAIVDFDAAIRANAEFGQAYLGRGQARVAQRDFAGAMADFDRSMRLDPGPTVSIARCRLHAEHPEVPYDPSVAYCRPTP